MGFELPSLADFQWPQLLEVCILASFYYYILVFLRGTRGAQVLSGMVLSLFCLFLVSNLLHLYTLNWILKQLSVILPLAFVVIFQPEIRRALAELGRGHVFTTAAYQREIISPLVEAVTMLADRKIGAIMAIEREIGTKAIQQSGTPIDSVVSPELLASLFFPRSPLHDGGVIIRGDRIVAAGCVFPLSQREELSKSLGTRHRAAIGLTEEIDAIVLVVSEETGTISLAYNGKLSRGLDREKLERMLGRMLRGKKVEGEPPPPPSFVGEEVVEGS